ncbi:MAG: signal recognition particle-docking protein FtsY, partial [Nanoarchaeota archaeon]
EKPVEIKEVKEEVPKEKILPKEVSKKETPKKEITLETKETKTVPQKKLSLPLSREKAWELVLKHNSDSSDLNHYLESEAVMRALARKLGENEEYFGMLGLLHDIDWGATKNDTSKHLTKASELLRKAGFDDDFINIILSHGYGFDCAGLKEKKRTQKLEHALAASETVTGLVHAYALMRGGLEGMEAKGLKKKFKDKAFAAGIRREIIQECELMGVSLDEFLQLSIEAISGIKEKLHWEKKLEEKVAEKKTEPEHYGEKKEVKAVKKKEVTEIKENIPEKAAPVTIAETPIEEEKRGFFSKLFGKKEEQEPLTEIPVPEKFNPATQKYEPDLAKIKDISVEKEEVKAEEIPEKKSFFDKLKQTLTTKTISAEKFEELFWELEVALLENNVSVEVIEKIKEDLKKELVEKPLPRDIEKVILDTLHRTLQEILSTEKIDLLKRIKTANKKPYIIAFFGINGSGKTTSIAKLTYYLQQQGLSIVLAACDTFRAAAIQQLEEHANKLGVKMIKHDYGSDAAAVAFDAVKYAEKNSTDVVLIDTAGRLHSNTNLMAELEKILRVTKPDLKLFIGESITGNDCIEQARTFNQLVEMDGVILTKADVDEKGGAPLSIAYTIKKPILFLGMGQEYKDLEEFNAEKILGRLGL